MSKKRIEITNNHGSTIEAIGGRKFSGKQEGFTPSRSEDDVEIIIRENDSANITSIGDSSIEEINDFQTTLSGIKNSLKVSLNPNQMRKVEIILEEINTEKQKPSPDYRKILELVNNLLKFANLAGQLSLNVIPIINHVKDFF